MVSYRKQIVPIPKSLNDYDGRVLVRKINGDLFSYKLLEESIIPCFKCLLRVTCDITWRYSCFLYMEAIEEHGEIHRYA